MRLEKGAGSIHDLDTVREGAASKRLAHLLTPEPVMVEGRAREMCGR